MLESFEDYKKRIVDYVADRNPLELQQSMPDTLASLVQQLDPEKLTQRPRPDKWSIQEIVAHLADDELVGAYRIRMILNMPGTPIQAFDQAQWGIIGQYQTTDIKQSLALFRQLRQANLALFNLLTPIQWEFYGHHEERGKETIRDIVRYYAGHDINHLIQIKMILKDQ